MPKFGGAQGAIFHRYGFSDGSGARESRARKRAARASLRRGARLPEVPSIFFDPRQGRKTYAEKTGAESGGIPGRKRFPGCGYSLEKIASGKGAEFHGIPEFWRVEKWL
jgi:hypothetical protein